MNRYNFLESKGTPQLPRQDLLPKGHIEAGQRWNSTINGSTLNVISRASRDAWTVRETVKGNMRTHDNGEREMLETFILSFYKQQHG